MILLMRELTIRLSFSKSFLCKPTEPDDHDDDDEQK